MAEYKVSDSGDLRKYFTQIPNMVDDSDLSVYAFRLYAHLKRVAGDNGLCYQSTSTLATACKMSMGSVKKAKDELAASGLIRIKVIPGEHGEFARHEIEIVDIWAENIGKYTRSPDESTYSPHEQERITTRTGASQDVNRTVSPGETKKNPIKNNQLRRTVEEEGKTPAAPTSIPGIIASATGMVTIPPKEMERIEQVHTLVDHYGVERVTDAMQEAFNKWITTRGKSGTYYKRTNFGWVDWAQEALAEEESPAHARQASAEPVRVQLPDYLIGETL